MSRSPNSSRHTQRGIRRLWYVVESTKLTTGHYIGWARKDEEAIVPMGEEEWYKYDGKSWTAREFLLILR